MMEDNRPEPVKQPRRPHRKTGRRAGPPKGSANAWRTGLNSAAAVARRKEVNAMLRAARQAIREAR